MTVSIYKHTDTGAPQLTNTAGSINTVLEWALTKKGWTIPFRDDANKIMCFKSGDASSTQAFLRIDDSVANGAAVKGYQTMTDVNTGTGAFHVNNAHFGRQNAVGWIVVADEKGFYFCPRMTISGNNRYHIYYFGDFNSIVSVDAGRAMLMSSDRPGFYAYDWQNGNNGKKIMGNHDLTQRNMSFIPWTCSPHLGNQAEGAGHSGRRELYQAFIHHDSHVRGLMPGLYVTPTRLDSNDPVELQNIAGLGAEKVLILPINYSSSKSACGISLTDWGVDGSDWVQEIRYKAREQIRWYRRHRRCANGACDRGRGQNACQARDCAR